MITIFCDFCQFSAKKLAFFSKTNFMITIFLAVPSLSKNANILAKYFGENIFEIITSVPDVSVEKIAKNEARPTVCQIEYITLTAEKRINKTLVTYVGFLNVPNVENCPNLVTLSLILFRHTETRQNATEHKNATKT
jgi:hypothetical protein